MQKVSCLAPVSEIGSLAWSAQLASNLTRVQPVQAALADEKCVVIGLQSTGDARTVEAVAERAVDGELDDFVSGPKVTLVS